MFATAQRQQMKHVQVQLWPLKHVNVNLIAGKIKNMKHLSIDLTFNLNSVFKSWFKKTKFSIKLEF